MSNKEIVEYCRKLVIANLSQYIETNPKLLSEMFIIHSDDELLLLHLKGLKNFIEKAINIIEKDKE